jgi:chorismate synthase
MRLYSSCLFLGIPGQSTMTNETDTKKVQSGVDFGEGANAAHIKGLIRNLESEKAVHDTKFAENPLHTDCHKRFDNVLAQLQDELAKLLAETA